jgi:hypothetical protein
LHWRQGLTFDAMEMEMESFFQALASHLDQRIHMSEERKKE